MMPNWSISKKFKQDPQRFISFSISFSNFEITHGTFPNVNFLAMYPLHAAERQYQQLFGSSIFLDLPISGIALEGMAPWHGCIFGKAASPPLRSGLHWIQSLCSQMWWRPYGDCTQPVEGLKIQGGKYSNLGEGHNLHPWIEQG